MLNERSGAAAAGRCTKKARICGKFTPFCDAAQAFGTLEMLVCAPTKGASAAIRAEHREDNETGD
jgi:hypothetical protein